MALGYLDDSKLTAVANAIRGKTGKSATMTVDEMPTEIASISGGGGVTNVVIGDFTTPYSYGAKTLNIDYSGSGYPIACMVYVYDGPFNSQTGHKAWYNLVARYAVGTFMAIKDEQHTEPTYKSSGTENMCNVYALHKDSTSSSLSYNHRADLETFVFSGSAATQAGAYYVVTFKDNTTMSYYVRNSSYGLAQGMKYRYIVVYSE